MLGFYVVSPERQSANTNAASLEADSLSKPNIPHQPPQGLFSEDSEYPMNELEEVRRCGYGSPHVPPPSAFSSLLMVFSSLLLKNHKGEIDTGEGSLIAFMLNFGD